jgi:ATP-binding cassette subfamily A (ABC1) protein 3
MDEADSLSDRIVILSNGSVKCCGSPTYLKRLYGSGHVLTIIKNKYFKKESLFILLNSLGVNFKLEIDLETQIKLSINSDNIQRISKILEKIDEQKVYFGIISYNISSPSIEDVFIK